MMKLLLGISLCLLVILLVYTLYQKYELYNNILHGMWIADDDFLESAELSGMYLYIGEPYKTTATESYVKTYLILHKKAVLVYSAPVDLVIAHNLSLVSPVHDEIAYDIQYYDRDDTELIPEVDDTPSINEIMPRHMTMYFDPNLSRLVFRGVNDEGEERLYAKFYKDASAVDTPQIE